MSNNRDNIKLNFEKHAVAFIDILGFKDFIKTAEKENSEKSKLANLLKSIKETPSFGEGKKNNPVFPTKLNLSCLHVSDSFIVTAPCENHQSLPALIAVCIKSIQIYQEILKLGFASRGAIAVGNLMIDGKNIYGTAYIDAVESEKNISIHPRILLTESSIKELDKLSQYELNGLPFDFFC